MSSGWQSVGRCAAGLLAQAARHASHASTSTSAASSGEPAARSALQQALSCGQWRQPGGGGGGHGGGCGGGAPVRGLSTSAAPAAQTLPEEPDEPHEDQRDRELEEQLGDPGQVGDARFALLTALHEFQGQTQRHAKGRFHSHTENEMHYSIAPISTMRHENEESRAEYFRQWGRQLEKETSVLRDAVREYEEASASAKDRSDAAAMGPSQEVMRHWFPAVTARIQREQDEILQGSPVQDVSVYGPYFCLLEPKYLAVIAINYTLNSILSHWRSEAANGRVRMAALTTTLGKAVQQQVHLEQLKKKVREDNQRRRDLSRLVQEGKAAKEALAEKGVAEFSPYDAESWRARFQELGETLPPDVKAWFKVSKDDAEFAQRAKQTRSRWALAKAYSPKKSSSKSEAARALKKHARIALGDEAVWPPTAVIKVGGKLAELLVDAAVTPLPNGSSVRAFWQETVFERGPGRVQKMGYLVANPAVLRQIEANEEIAKTAFPKFKPMLVEPVPWRNASTGAHLTVRSFVMRTREQQANRKLLEEADRDMVAGRGPGASQVYKALNILGSVGWRINGPVLTAAQAAWDAGGSYAGLPTRDIPLPLVEPRLPQRFRSVNTPNQLVAHFGHAHPYEAKQVRWEYLRAKKERDEAFSQRCDIEYKLAVAREFAEEPAFYYPHSLDFRGRAYPMHPHLNHLGADVCRGLLQFAQARPLGQHGLFWLKVSVANLYGGGADKLPMEGRAEFAEQYMEQILQTADDPLAPETTWWLDADEPWQLLAACIDIAAAVRSGNPEAHLSALPVHQDGSCNGLQHYAALGRDAWGGHAVNLTPTDGPQDVYTEIANVVRKKVAADSAKERNPWAPLLHDFIDRKLVKQTVMTSVYGITYVGARQQMSNRLKDKGWTDDEAIFRTASYAARVTLDSLLDMFRSAKDIMGWLADCASVVAGEDKPVKWATPLGLPVIQPYRLMRKRQVRTMLQSVILERHSDNLPVMKARQRSAFPPNFIHSVDSSHMMLTALACAEEGLAFAGVHDSFWTHAGSVPRMNELLREQFVALHSQPLLEELLASFQEQHPGVEFPPLPPRGDLDLEGVKDSTYFFS